MSFINNTTGDLIDLANDYMTTTDLVDKFVGKSLFVSGYNASGQLGLGDTTSRSSLIFVNSNNWNNVSSGFSTSSGMTILTNNSGTLWSCGANGNGQLGLGNTTTISTLTQVGALTDWNLSKISSSGINCAVIKSNGTLWLWGYNGMGLLGQNDIVHRSSPTQVGALTNWKEISISGHALAIKTDGTLWAWGANGYGQQGYTSVHTSSPTQVGSLTDWKSISTGNAHSLFIKIDGSLWCCGDNTYGQLGKGYLSSNIQSPVQIGSLTNWSKIAALGNSSFAIKNDGTLWAWGYNGNGQLGLGNITTMSSPTQVGSLTNWNKLPKGSTIDLYNMGAMKTDGTLWSWGYNSNGQLGLNNIVHRSSPVQVGALTNWKDISVGYSTIALASNN